MPHHLRICICLFSVFLTLLTSLSVAQKNNAQQPDSSRHIVEDGYIEKMDDSFSIKLSLDSDYETFRVQTETNDIKLSPNVTNVATIGLNYRSVVLHVGFASDFLPGNGDNDIKGETKAINIGLALIRRRLFSNIQYTNVQGFYLQNTNDYIPWEKGEPYIQFPDLHYQGISINTGYRFNPKVSLRSIITQTERQLRSAGSFIPELNLHYYVIDDQSTPAQGGATQKSNNVEWSVGFGYIYTFVLSYKFYCSLSFVPSLGSIHTKLLTRYPGGDVKSTQNNLAFRYDTKGALGYNGRKFFAGAYLGLSGVSNRQANTTVVNHGTRLFYQFFVGMRINAPRAVNKEADKIQKTIGGHN